MLGAAGAGEIFHNNAERGGWDSQIVGRPLRLAQFPMERLKSRRVVIIPVHVAEQARQLLKGHGIQSAVFLHTIHGPRLELVQIPTGLGHADDGHVNRPPSNHRLQSRENLLVSQIAGGLFLRVTAESEAHRREQFVLVIRLAARGESFVERRCEHRDRHAFVNRRLDGPPAFARIGNAAGELRQLRVGGQRARR